jgi:hypothetical protein
MRITRLIVALALPIAVQGQNIAPITIEAQRQTLTLQDAIRMARSKASKRKSRAVHATPPSTATTRSTRVCCRSSSCADAAQPESRHQADVHPDGTTQFIGQSEKQSTFSLGFRQAIPLTGGTISVLGDRAYDQFGDNDKKSTRRRRRREPATGSVPPRAIVWDKRVQSSAPSSPRRGYLEAREDVAGNTADAFFNLYAAGDDAKERVGERRRERHAVHAEQGPLRSRQDRRERPAQE